MAAVAALIYKMDMKRIIIIVVLAVIVLSTSLGIRYIYKKNQENPVVYTTETAKKGSIVKKTVATGSIVPKEEVLIKQLEFDKCVSI